MHIADGFAWRAEQRSMTLDVKGLEVVPSSRVLFLMQT